MMLLQTIVGIFPGIIVGMTMEDDVILQMGDQEFSGLHSQEEKPWYAWSWCTMVYPNLEKSSEIPQDRLGLLKICVDIVIEIVMIVFNTFQN